MADGVRISWSGLDLKGLEARVRKVGLLGRLGEPAQRRILTAVGLHMQAMTARAFKAQRDPATGTPWRPLNQITRQARPGGGGKARALMDTGALMRDVVQSAPKIKGAEVSIGTSLKYAKLHQFGGVVRPRNTKYLAIPLTREARRATSMKRWIQQNPGRTFTKRSGKGNMVAFKREGGRITPHFLLVKQVDVPARPFLGWPKDATTQRKFSEFVQAEVNKAWTGQVFG